MIISGISQGLFWGVMALGLFMTFRILNFPDMTAEGSFPLGGAVVVVLIRAGVSPLVATLAAMIAGCLTGLLTGLLHTKGQVPLLLAGILVMSGMNSVMLLIMQSANLSLLNFPKLVDGFLLQIFPENLREVILGLFICLLFGFLLFGFTKTTLGQAFIASGDNPAMTKNLGIDAKKMERLGLICGNGLISLSGALLAQSDGYADVNKGFGVIVIGLSAIILGEVLFGQLTLGKRLWGTVVGAVLYQLLLVLIIQLGLDTTYLKGITAIILAGFLMLPHFVKGGAKK
ncbi:ABC transporter permease [Enterococcus timonensis]|uniref:ABC transporter permease n=1 Tax=Enterococcus timonensis TaxID=1852364 RepID=UPI0008DA9520|nr:branched-chain amino acid ABC transporter permease [Enterococcus timonensis]